MTNTSRSTAGLPEPDESARQHSRALSSLIASACGEQGGRISFRQFMEMALYQPGLGYYSSGLQKFGASGDFVTAPEVSPVFSSCLARQVAQVIEHLGSADILEFGAGSGVMAADMLLELERLNALPVRYYIVELSAGLRERQLQTISSKGAHLTNRVHWLDALPQRPIKAVVVANEVLDAMPVECFRINQADVEQLCVQVEDEHLQACYRPADAGMVRRIRDIEHRRQQPFANGYCSEYNPALRAWFSGIDAALDAGAVLLIDYGYPLQEYYLAERDKGTLMCHYQHRAHADPLWYPGLQDITAFVDFSSVAGAAVDAGFELSGYTSQAMFLMGCGLEQVHRSLQEDNTRQQLLLAQQIKTLTLPSEMGERFKAMALSKGIDLSLAGFGLKDYRNRL